MLPTDKASRLVKFQMFGKNKLNYSDEILPIQDEEQYQHLYIVPTNEEIKKNPELFKIKEGDWVFDAISNSVKQVANGNPQKFPCKKIIATTDSELSEINQCDGCQKGLPIDDGIHRDEQMFGIACTKNRYKQLPQPSKAFIEKYCKVGGIDEVDVEYEWWQDVDDTGVGAQAITPPELIFKVDSHNKIIIYLIKDSWTREEVEELKRLADAVINPAAEILPDTYDEELKAYFDWKLE